MAIPNFFGQSQQALQSGLRLGGALQNAESLRMQREQQAQDAEFKSQLRPLQLERAELSNQAMMQDNEKKALLQDAILLSSLDEEAGKEIIPQLINKYEGNEPVLAMLKEQYQATGADYIKNNLLAVSAFSGKPLMSKKEKEKPAAVVEFDYLTEGLTEDQKKEAKLIELGLSPRAVGSAIQTIAEKDIAEAVGDAEATIKERAKFGELTGASRSKAIDKGFEKITKINKGISNIDNAISALDKGAGVGAIEKLFPSIKAASVELDNIRGSMALDVIGSTTFGALSEGELSLAKDIALPTGLNTTELRDYLYKRKIAQEKLRNYYNEQIEHLEQGGTVASFLREKERGLESQAEPKSSFVIENHPQYGNVTEDDIQETMRATGMTRDEVLSRLRG